MFRCERCGTGFNATTAAFMDCCPRCKARGIKATVSFRLFDPGAPVAGLEDRRPKRGSEVTEEKRPAEGDRA